MPISLSHIQFMRRLSIQPEESGGDFDDESSGKQSDSFGKGNGYINDPNDLPLIPCVKRGPNNANYQDDELRRLSVASMISAASTSSLSSTYSAPGIMSTSVPGHCPLSQSEETYDLKPMTRRLMTSRPSFISLCSIVSETSEAPQHLLPAPLQVELDLMQRMGIEGDEPKCRSHLPILRCPSDYDISEMDVESIGGQFIRRSRRTGLVKGIKDFPKRMRKLSTEKNRFDIYSISDETRDQLKRLYVY